VRLDSGAFLVVFAALFLVHSAVPARVKRLLLVVGSVAFYATLTPRHVPLFLSLGVFSYFVGTRIHRETLDARRDVLLRIGVGVNVLVLALFKCAAPAAGSLASLGFRSRPQLLAITVPLGMSFYVLQAVSYIVDVHRRVHEPPRSVLSFLASFTLFPHLLSGPIVRSSFLVPLVERVESVSWPTARRALLLFMVGLVEKSIADRLASTADVAFDAKGTRTLVQAWTGLFAYAGQLYGDFSGYTDMATALALLLGLDLPPNFDLPYLATSPADFWRRWHISLSSWLRDYVYLPLGVRFRRRRYANILATWTVAGLWHGVSWLFVLYGLYHGALLAVTEWLSRRFPSDGDVRGVRRLAQTALTFYLVLMGYVLFRARSVEDAGRLFADLHRAHVPLVISQDAITTAAAAAAAIVFCHLLDHAVRRWRDQVERPWIMWPAMVVAVACLALFGGEAQPFIYFAF
jgi:D-alanyl-lipoteichoic acid acyltransferase DltB (MBOAT superfamily)